MSANLINACNALDALASVARDSWGDDRTLNETFGWHHPSVNRHDIADLPRKLAERMREISASLIDSELDAKLATIPQRLATLQSSTIPQLYNGNGAQAFPAFVGTIDWVRSIVDPILLPEVDWNDVEEQNLMPRALLRRLKSVDTQVNSIVNKSSDLDDKIDRINDAHAAAELLPTEVTQIEELKQKVETIHRIVDLQRSMVEKNQKTSEESLKIIESLENEARVILERCGQYSTAMTTKGLGESFQMRANSLQMSMRLWVVGLMLALGIGGYLGYERVHAISTILADNQVTLMRLFVNVAVAVFVVAAPIWFAWVSTKQIGQRFRLAEDYAFKSSVAQAYEGYRREASSFSDPEFPSRLFALALTRLEQEPLRYVETETHGSPFHEMLGLKFFRSRNPGSEAE
jgi:uncharacterized protein YdcH (DUF465 family)